MAQEKIEVRSTRPGSGQVSQLGATRPWMDESVERHAYMCFPMALTNRLGWGISFPEDIVFIWDGIDDTTPDHVKIIKGEEHASPNRGNATISFHSGLIFRTEEHTTMLTMPVPNQFIPGTQCFTTLISTSFYMPEFPLAWKITKANEEIVIPAGTPVAAVLPISLTNLQNNFVLEVNNDPVPPEYWDEVKKYGDAAEEKNKIGDWSKMYRDAVDYTGTAIGRHETKSIKLKTVVCPFTGVSHEVEDTDEPNHSDN
jgi:hypothetical protein